MLPHPTSKDYDFDQFEPTLSEFTFTKVTTFQGKLFF